MERRHTHFGPILCFAVTAILALSAESPYAAEPSTKSRAAPARIVSLNLCTDELVLQLADRSKISSITWLSKDPISANVVDLAADVPINHGLAEEIIPLNPDLIVAGTFTAKTK